MLYDRRDANAIMIMDSERGGDEMRGGGDGITDPVVSNWWRLE